MTEEWRKQLLSNIEGLLRVEGTKVDIVIHGAAPKHLSDPALWHTGDHVTVTIAAPWPDAPKGQAA